MTSKYDDQYLIHAAEADPEQTEKAVHDIKNQQFSIQTIRRRLREVGIWKQYAVKRAALTKQQAAKQLQWAQDHQHWT